MEEKAKCHIGQTVLGLGACDTWNGVTRSDRHPPLYENPGMQPLTPTLVNPPNSAVRMRSTLAYPASVICDTA